MKKYKTKQEKFWSGNFGNKYLQRNKISMEIFAYELKEDFSTSRQIIVDSENQVEEHQIALNSLEEQNNPYRCIFCRQHAQ